MKFIHIRRAAALLIVLMCFAVVSVALAGTMRYAPLGPAEDLLGKVSVYCDSWNTLIGSALDVDLSFDPDKLSTIEALHYDMGGNRVTTLDVDGIHLDVDSELTVYSVTIHITPTTEGQYAATSRIFAVLNALFMDLPHDESEMLSRYMDELEQYTAFLEENKNKLASTGLVYYDIAHFSSPKAADEPEFEVVFTAIGGRIHVTIDRLYFE